MGKILALRNKPPKPAEAIRRANPHSTEILSNEQRARFPEKRPRDGEISRENSYVSTFLRFYVSTTRASVRCKRPDKGAHCQLNAGSHLAWISGDSKNRHDFRAIVATNGRTSKHCPSSKEKRSGWQTLENSEGGEKTNERQEGTEV